MKTGIRTVGCFEISPIQEGKWRVVNQLTGIAHATFGTEREVVDQARVQTAAWARKKSVKLKKGQAWRQTMLPAR